MKVNIKMGGLSLAMPLPDNEATVKKLRELLKASMPGYDDKKFVFLKGGIPIATDAEQLAKLSDNEEIVLREESGPINIKMVLDNGQKKVTCIEKGKTLSDVRTAIAGWPELKDKNFFFFSGAEGDAYCVESSDEGKVVLSKDATYNIKLDDEIATDLADFAVKKKETAEEKKKTKEDALIKENKAKLKELMSDMKAEVPENKLRAIADMEKVISRDFKTVSKLVDTNFSAQPEFDITNDFFSFVEDQEMLFDLVNRTGILKGIIVGSAQGELVQHGFFNIMNYKKPESKEVSYFNEMKKKYMAQLAPSGKKS